MPRPIRVEFSGAMYHVVNRGDRLEVIFQDDIDRDRGGGGAERIASSECPEFLRDAREAQTRSVPLIDCFGNAGMKAPQLGVETG